MFKRLQNFSPKLKDFASIETWGHCIYTRINFFPLKSFFYIMFYLKQFYLKNSLKCLLKTVDTIGNCQRQVFSLGVSQHMHKITNLWKFELNWSLKLRDNNERKNTLVMKMKLCHEVVCFKILGFGTQILNLRSQNQIHGKLLLSRKLTNNYFE